MKDWNSEISYGALEGRVLYMAGIVSYGVYIPKYRLPLEMISQAWRGLPSRGEKAVANYDEDSLTMAAEALLDSLDGLQQKSSLQGLLFASTTPPYREKLSSTLLAQVAGCSSEVFATDVTDSLRGSTLALQIALDRVTSGKADQIAVVASDCRIALPQSEEELLLGDGAAAVVIGRQEAAVVIESIYSLSDPFLDVWRRDQDRYVQSWEDRYVRREGYERLILQGIMKALQESGHKPGDFARVVCYSPDPRHHLGLLRRCGFSLEDQLEPQLYGTVGNTGCAYTLMILCAAFEKIKPGDKVLVISYGDGVDACILRATETVGSLCTHKGFTHYLQSKEVLRSYSKYLSWRNQLATAGARRPSPQASLPRVWRERKEILNLHGARCNHCGTVQFPIPRVCYQCLRRDNFTPTPLARLKGTIFTYTKDYLFGNPTPPLVMTVTEMSNGCRLYFQMTDENSDEVRTGMEVEPTFRLFHEAGGFKNYFWKVRPVR